MSKIKTNERTERIMRCLSYLPLVTTSAALIFTGVYECREKIKLNREIASIYRIEYETCDNPGGLERAKKAFVKAKNNKNFRRAGCLRNKIREMEYDRPSRIRQCEIIRRMKKIQRR